jgi:hypothetical protein
MRQKQAPNGRCAKKKEKRPQSHHLPTPMQAGLLKADSTYDVMTLCSIIFEVEIRVGTKDDE